jgi:hypothetical protein
MKGKPVGRPRHRWENNIRMHIRKVGWDMSTGFIWFKIRTSVGILGTW